MTGAVEPLIHVEVAGPSLPLDGPVGLCLPPGATLAEALRALGVDADALPGVGIWGRRAKPDTPLRDGDRIECYRALRIDPKTARRARASAERKS